MASRGCRCVEGVGLISGDLLGAPPSPDVRTLPIALVAADPPSPNGLLARRLERLGHWHHIPHAPDALHGCHLLLLGSCHQRGRQYIAGVLVEGRTSRRHGLRKPCRGDRAAVKDSPGDVRGARIADHRRSVGSPPPWLACPSSSSPTSVSRALASTSSTWLAALPPLARRSSKTPRSRACSWRTPGGAWPPSRRRCSSAPRRMARQSPAG